MIEFNYKLFDEGINLYLLDNGNKLKIDAWNILDQLNQIEVISIIEEKSQTDVSHAKVLNDKEGYFLTHEFVSSLTDIQAKSIDLPPSFPFKININTSGAFTQPSFKINLAVYDKKMLVKTKRIGCFVDDKGKIYRLPNYLYKIWHEIDEFKKHDNFLLDRNIEFISKLKTFFPVKSFNGSNETYIGFLN